MQAVEVYFQPPLAIARVGPGPQPAPNFRWATDRSLHGAHQTTIRPDVTLSVAADGGLSANLSDHIQFRDGDLLRPVAPFFELWVRYLDDAGLEHDEPLTGALLGALGGALAGVRYRVSVANRKAERRTLSAACGFEARVEFTADDHARRELLAFSPHNPGEIPLVAYERPIPLGAVQAIRPSAGEQAFGDDYATIDFDVLRLRFTPAKGEVYGTQESTQGPASPLPPGGALPAITLGGRVHEIVPPPNRILNSGTPWSTYKREREGVQQDPQPSDSYDGANTGDNSSWGVVDDTCDGVIEAQLVLAGQRFLAHARVFSSCPDYAPDRRAFYSFADELADRDLPAPDGSLTEMGAAIADLFQRVFEVASSVNLAATRNHGILENAGSGVTNPNWLPHTDKRTMTQEDRPYARLTAELSPPTQGPSGASTNPELYASIAALAHAKLTDVESLIDFLASDPERVRQMLRPPFARFAELPERPPGVPARTHRDPRTPRDTMQDMRMPPYMRDSDENALSLTYRQYHALLRLSQELSRSQAASGRLPSGASPAERRVAEHVRRIRAETQARSEGRS